MEFGSLSIWHWLIFSVPYFLPAIIATVRRHRHMLAIWLLNIFAGWTGIGWVVVAIWALFVDSQDRKTTAP